MATLKFKDPSPYMQKRPKVPAVDFVYSRWVEEIDEFLSVQLILRPWNIWSDGSILTADCTHMLVVLIKMALQSCQNLLELTLSFVLNLPYFSEQLISQEFRVSDVATC